MVIPTEIVSGLSVSFRVSLLDYPASEWGANLYLVSLNNKVEITATNDGDDFVFSATAAETAQWSAEKYSALIRVTKGEDVHQPVSERLTVLPNLAAMDSHDPRSDAEKALFAIQATLANRATSDQLKLSFGGRSLEKTPLSDLLKLEARFIRQVNNERRKKAGRSLFKINKVRMR
ncbi:MULTISPECIES: hypothetical protein [Vibrio]|uniref:hypothetical protein n=1 Tax=Vibrio TaxID=662 RepID=UPI001C7C7BAC|nr:hypothetical protein [Vibrio antiquarius]MCR9549008.1 hypothetical protein [Vibrio antiquarius]HBI3715644.1 hypothetical protein [Vibrio parahaemolyticus]